jgi:hypothetical protein
MKLVRLQNRTKISSYGILSLLDLFGREFSSLLG